MEKWEKQYEREEDARTLKRMAEIESSPKRKSEATKELAKDIKEAEKGIEVMQTALADKKPKASNPTPKASSSSGGWPTRPGYKVG